MGCLVRQLFVIVGSLQGQRVVAMLRSRTWSAGHYRTKRHVVCVDNRCVICDGVGDRCVMCDGVDDWRVMCDGVDDWCVMCDGVGDRCVMVWVTGDRQCDV